MKNTGSVLVSITPFKVFSNRFKKIYIIEIAKLGPAHVNRGREAHTSTRGSPGAHSIASHQGRREDSQEDTPKNKE